MATYYAGVHDIVQLNRTDIGYIIELQTVSHTVVITDNVNGNFDPIAVNDTVIITDRVNGNFNPIAVSDTVTITESFNSYINDPINVAQSVAIVQEIIGYTLTQSVSDVITISDYPVGILPNVSQTITITETFLYTNTVGSLHQTISLSSVAQLHTHRFDPYDYITLTQEIDATTSTLASPSVDSESLSIVETITANTVRTRSVDDSVSIQVGGFAYVD